MDIENYNNGYGARLVLTDEEKEAAKLIHYYLPADEEERRAEEISGAKQLIESAAADLARRYPKVKTGLVLNLARALPEFPNPEYVWARTDGASVLTEAFTKERRVIKAEKTQKNTSEEITHE
jgi:hypothetical protein